MPAAWYDVRAQPESTDFREAYAQQERRIADAFRRIEQQLGAAYSIRAGAGLIGGGPITQNPSIDVVAADSTIIVGANNIRANLAYIGSALDHGNLQGLADDDHAQYLFAEPSSTDNRVVRWDGTSGRAVQVSGVTIDDSANASGFVSIAFDGTAAGDGQIRGTDYFTIYGKTTGGTDRYLFFWIGDALGVGHPSHDLDLAGATIDIGPLRWPSADGSDGHVMTTDGAGMLSLASPYGTAVSLSWSSAQNNYALGSGVTHMRVSPTGAVQLTGIANGVQGRVVHITCTSSAIDNFLLLRNENISSSDANRFALLQDVVLGPGETVSLFYDDVTDRWRMLDTAGFHPFCVSNTATTNSSTVETYLSFTARERYAYYISVYLYSQTTGESAVAHTQRREYCVTYPTGFSDPNIGSATHQLYSYSTGATLATMTTSIDTGTDVVSLQFTPHASLTVYHTVRVEVRIMRLVTP